MIYLKDVYGYEFFSKKEVMVCIPNTPLILYANRMKILKSIDFNNGIKVNYSSVDHDRVKSLVKGAKRHIKCTQLIAMKKTIKCG